MVRFCQEDVGIGIYVDAVINHLLSRGTPDGVGFLGTEYRGFASDPLQPEIVDLFGPQDFHTDFDKQNIDIELVAESDKLDDLFALDNNLAPGSRCDGAQSGKHHCHDMCNGPEPRNGAPK